MVGNAVIKGWFLNSIDTILLFLTSYACVVVLAGLQLNIFWALSIRRIAFHKN
jgi:hypothetical protein